MKAKSVVDLNTLRGILESLLFVADRPLSSSKLSQIAEVDESTAKKVLASLAEEYSRENRGFQLREIGGGWRFYTHPGHASYVEKLVLSSDYRRLTQAALETLAIVAYKQPVTRAEISAIRGVNAEAVLSSLIGKELIKEVGRESSPGQPIIYGTAQNFLEAFGLKDISELPPLEEFSPDEKTRQQIEEKLRAEPPSESEGEEKKVE